VTGVEQEYNELIRRASGRDFVKGLHKHRINPGYSGGEYVPGNVLFLTRQEHIQIHRLRHGMLGNHRLQVGD